VTDVTSLYPLLFEPALKHYVWGGRNLDKLLGRRLPPGKIAESWEISAHPDGQSVVFNGLYAGMTLGQLHEGVGLDLIGRHAQWAQTRGVFPLLIKLLDAHQRLSVQVHPDDAYARQHEGNELGKTEMWVVLHAKPGASIILGVTQGTTPHTFREAVNANRLEPLLHRIELKTGDFVCVPSGSLHAILGGLLIAEIQQTSNVTYRVYDWGRKEAGRPLHVRQALEVINFDQVEPTKPKPEALDAPPDSERERLCRNRYFTVERWRLPAGGTIAGDCDGGSLEIYGLVEGKAVITGGGETVGVDAVRFALLPARLGDYELRVTEPATILRIYIERL
jgi:mannose-6-phosphate isomerase